MGDSTQGVKFNMSKGRGKISVFKPVDNKKPKVREPKPKHDDGFNIGTFDMNGEKKPTK